MKIYCPKCLNLFSFKPFVTSKEEKILKEKIKRLENKLKKYKKLSLKDFLTGLWNERKLKEDLKRYSEIQKRSKVKFTVALLDIDNFKKYNDENGHEYGDKILKKLADILQSSIRHYENVYRIGSGADEFVIILSHNNNHHSTIGRIRKKLNKENISCSIGYSNLNKNVLKVIDKKMYKKKKRKK